MRSAHLASAAVLCICAGAAFAQPANDNCSTPQVITGFGSTNFDTGGSNTDGPSIGCASGQNYNDVWFLWTAAASGDVLCSLCAGTGRDTVITVYEGAGCPSGGEIACNDDSCAYESKTRFTAVGGQQYLIRVGSYSDGDTGSGVLAVSEAPPVGVLCGPIVNPANGHTYYMLEAGSWTAAEARAVELGGHLATVRNDDENVFIINNLMRFDGVGIRRGWIGLNDAAQVGTYVWTSGEPVTYTNWGAGEPNHANGEEFYAQIPWFSPQWNDNRDLPGDDIPFGIVEIIPPNTCVADIGSTGGVPGADGSLDNNDFIVFIDYFFNANPLADRGTTGGVPGTDGAFDNNDFIVFIDQFFTGCN